MNTTPQSAAQVLAELELLAAERHSCGAQAIGYLTFLRDNAAIPDYLHSKIDMLLNQWNAAVERTERFR